MLVVDYGLHPPCKTFIAEKNLLAQSLFPDRELIFADCQLPITQVGVRTTGFDECRKFELMPSASCLTFMQRREEVAVRHS